MKIFIFKIIKSTKQSVRREWLNIKKKKTSRKVLRRDSGWQNCGHYGHSTKNFEAFRGICNLFLKITQKHPAILYGKPHKSRVSFEAALYDPNFRFGLAMLFLTDRQQF